MAKQLLFLIMFFCSMFCWAQHKIDSHVKELDFHFKFKKIVVNRPDEVIYARVCSEQRKIRLSERKYYYWFSANDIKKTQGGYSGKLLHGDYISYYTDTNLKEKGRIKNGLQKGIWMYWYPNGKIKEKGKWSHSGVKYRFKQYNEKGELLHKGTKVNNKLHGKVKNYSEKGIVVTEYDEGDEMLNTKKSKNSELKKADNKMVREKNKKKNGKEQELKEQEPSN